MSTPRRRRTTGERQRSRFPWKGALLILVLAAIGLGIGSGTALVAQRLAARPSPSPQVVVAMTPPPAGSFETVAPSTPIPANMRFSTAKPAQLTPAPTLPPTPVPTAPPTPTPTPEPTDAQALVVPTPYTATPRPAPTASPAARHAAQRQTALLPMPTPAPKPPITIVAEQFVREYLRALDRGDMTRAYAYLGATPGEPGIVAQEAPLAKDGRLHVLSLHATPDGIASAIVHARLESRGLRYKATYYIEPFIDGPHDLVIEHVDLQQE
ncbi:MAG TPA: hypothetical protein VNJ51_01125 [Candidatus Dormibacteraeota bacterium]|nr:hypothetical protein [Candidatus Dormibacteraeota bacterium]